MLFGNTDVEFGFVFFGFMVTSPTIYPVYLILEKILDANCSFIYTDIDFSIIIGIGLSGYIQYSIIILIISRLIKKRQAESQLTENMLDDIADNLNAREDRK